MLGIDYTSSQRYFIQCCIITENSRKINPFLKIFLQGKNGLLTHCFGHAKIPFFLLCEFLLPFWEADQKIITLVTCNIIIRIFPVMSAFFAMKICGAFYPSLPAADEHPLFLSRGEFSTNRVTGANCPFSGKVKNSVSNCKYFMSTSILFPQGCEIVDNRLWKSLWRMWKTVSFPH